MLINGLKRMGIRRTKNHTEGTDIMMVRCNACHNPAKHQLWEHFSFLLFYSFIRNIIQSMDSKIQTSIKISKIYHEVCAQGNKISSDQADDWAPNQINDVAIILQEKLQAEPIDRQQVREILTVATQLAKYKENYQIISKIFDANFLHNYSKYVQVQENEHLAYAAYFVEKMFLDKGYMIFSSSQELFQAYTKKFGSLPTELVREIVTQILVQMLLDNPKLIPFANQPYYFLQFWLHMINQQNQMDRMQYWLSSVRALYLEPQAEELLFYENDLRLMADIIVRVIETVTEGNQLKKPLQCYLALCDCKALFDQTHYRAQDIKEFLSAINPEDFGIQDLVEKINSLS